MRLNTLLSAGASALVSAAAFAQPGLVINEIDYDQIGTDTAEFVEIYNGSAAPVNLADYTLYFVNGANNAVYLTVTLGPGTLAPGGYWVLGSATVTNVNQAFGAAQDSVQNGAPDGVALVHVADAVLVDALSYEGSVTAAIIPGIGTASLVEGSPTSVADDNVTPGRGLSRLPNGTDTNNASADWANAPITPGAANLGCTPASVSLNPPGYRACVGETFSFTAVHNGQGSVTFTWRHNGNLLLDGPHAIGVISGAATGTLTITGATASASGSITCTVNDACAPVTSDPAGLAVFDPDVNGDGALNGFDIEFLEQVVNGASCQN